MELENEQNTHKFWALFKKNNATTLADPSPSHMEKGHVTSAQVPIYERKSFRMCL